MQTVEERRKVQAKYRASKAGRAVCDAYNLAYRKTHKKQQIEYVRKWQAARRLRVIVHYCKGKPHCMCPGCRTTYVGFLQIDHKLGGGCKHRKNLTRTGNCVADFILKNNFPFGFQILCSNCNGPGGKRNRKRCPLHGQCH